MNRILLVGAGISSAHLFVSRPGLELLAVERAAPPPPDPMEMLRADAALKNFDTATSDFCDFETPKAWQPPKAPHPVRHRKHRR